MYMLNCRDISAVKVTVRFKLPSCVGLGSSGAYCVCVAAALLQAVGLIPPPAVQVGAVGTCANSMHFQYGGDGEPQCTWGDAHLDLIRKWAASAESLIHGRASGIDAAVCTYGESMRAFFHFASSFANCPSANCVV